MTKEIKDILNKLTTLIESIKDIDEKIDTINFIRTKIHEYSPLKHHPVDLVVWEKSNYIEKNDYNPNSIPTPEFQLLVTSIKEDGYTMPIYVNPEINKKTIIDGFHRRSVLLKEKDISQSTFNRLPITISKEDKRDISNRMVSTIRHNRARGNHDIDLMSEIVSELISIGKTDKWIMKNIGMDSDELLRLKQITGLSSLFKDEEFSKAWE